MKYLVIFSILWFSLFFSAMFSLAAQEFSADSVKAYSQPVGSDTVIILVDKISINTASIDSLIALPGIGEVTAQRIIDARPFRSLYELLKVKGIGEKKFVKLYPYIKL